MPLFFMVSGWLQLPKHCPPRYCIRKILMMLRFVAIVIALVYFFRALSSHQITIFTHYISTLFGSYLQIGKFSVFWFFGAMSIIYLLLPLLSHLYERPKTFLWLTIALLATQNLAFIANLVANHSGHILFESTIFQPLRLWEWLGYFCLGGLLRRHPSPFKAEWWHLPIIVAALFILVNITGRWHGEFYYGSLVVQAYAIIIFLLIIRKQRRNNIVISSLSDVFLPVYAFHQFTISYLNIHFDLPAWALFVSAATITIGLSLLIVRIPGMKRVFRI